MRRALWLTALVLLAAGSARGVNLMPIADVKPIDAGGLPISYSDTVKVAGVVTVASGTFSKLDSKSDLDVYIQDSTGGINVYLKNGGYVDLKLGDSVVVTGQVDVGGLTPTRGNTRLKALSAQAIEIVGKTAVPSPLRVTAADLAKDAVPPLEPYEGLLVRLEQVTFNSADWPPAGTDKFVTAQDASGTFKIRLDKDTGIPGSVVPGQPFILVGVVVQDSPEPYLSGYNVWPRSRSTDFLVMGNGSGLAEAEPSAVDRNTSSFNLAVTLVGNGRDTITDFSIDLPLADGWAWAGEQVELSGPGLAGASYLVTATGVTVHGCSIVDAASSGIVTFKGVSSPSAVISSSLTIKTSVDGAAYAGIASEPAIASVRPKPQVVINEVFPDDGAEATSDAFIELLNKGAITADLEGLVLCESRAVPYCDPEVRYTFTAADTIPAGGYLVLAQSAAGFTQRFGLSPGILAGISPLGQVRGDGGICGSSQTYEAISLWRDASLSDLVDYVEYRDGIACESDMCGAFGTSDDALPVIPPRGYAIVSKTWSPCCPFEALSSDPSPGEPNRYAYLAPTVTSLVTYSQDIIEVFFSEPLDSAVSVSSFSVNGGTARAVFLSLSREKALVLSNDMALGKAATLEVKGLRSWAGIDQRDTTVDFTAALSGATKPCDIEAYDADGLSPLNGKVVTMFGFVTVPPGVFQPTYQSIYVQGLDGCGVNVFSYDYSSPRPVIGDFVQLTGTVTEYISAKAGSTTEISMPAGASLVIMSRSYPEPAPLVLSTGAVNKEDYEGGLVETEGAIVNASDFSFYIDDGSGGIQVYQNYRPIDFSQFHTGMYARVKGIVFQYDYTMPYLEGYELVPRYDSDIQIIPNAFPAKPVLSVDARVFCPSCGEDGFPIRFGAPASSDVTVRIFDCAGRLVSTLYSGASTGERQIDWRGRDENDRPLPAGLYICHIKVVEAVTGRTRTETAPIVIGTQLK